MALRVHAPLRGERGSFARPSGGTAQVFMSWFALYVFADSPITRVTPIPPISPISPVAPPGGRPALCSREARARRGPGD